MNFNQFAIAIRFPVKESMREAECWQMLSGVLPASVMAGARLYDDTVDDVDGRFYLCIAADIPFAPAKAMMEYLSASPALLAELPFYRPLLQSNRVFPLTDAREIGVVAADGTVEGAQDPVQGLCFSATEHGGRFPRKLFVAPAASVREDLRKLPARYPEGVCAWPVPVPACGTDAAELMVRLLHGSYRSHAVDGETVVLGRLADDTILLPDVAERDGEILGALAGQGHRRFAVFCDTLPQWNLPEDVILERHGLHDADFYETLGILPWVKRCQGALISGNAPEELVNMLKKHHKRMETV